MPQDLNELPKLRDSLSYLYVEKAVIERDNNAIVFIRAGECIPVPISSVTVLLIGPGTSITHAAMRIICQSGCLAVWCGEDAMHYYGFGMGETRSSMNLLRQAELCMDEGKHLQVVKRMYALRFPGISTSGMTLQQIRGLEGVRVRETYKTMSKMHGVKWEGRNYNRKDWDATDPLNMALSSANVCLYGLCHAAITSLGYSPGLGFIHTGKLTSFVYDIADLYKMQTTIPAAFETAAKITDTDEIGRTVRVKCRRLFREHKVLKRVAQDIEHIFDIGDIEPDINAEKPGDLWDDEFDTVEGGKNYAEDQTW